MVFVPIHNELFKTADNGKITMLRLSNGQRIYRIIDDEAHNVLVTRTGEKDFRQQKSNDEICIINLLNLERMQYLRYWSALNGT